MVPSVPSTNAQAGRKVLAEVRQSRSLGSTKFVLTVNWVIAARKPLLQQGTVQAVEHGRDSNHRQETVRKLAHQAG